MNRFATVYAILTAILLIAIGVAVSAATVEIETIVGTGPAFSIAGIVLCLVWCFHRRGLWAPLVPLSLPALSALVFLLIFSRSWGPQEAAQPVSAILLVYQVAAVTVGLIGIREQRTLSRRETSVGVQFSLKSMLILTGIAAVSLGGVRLALDYGASGSLGVAIGFTVLTILGIAVAFAYPLQPLDQIIPDGAVFKAKEAVAASTNPAKSSAVG